VARNRDRWGGFVNAVMNIGLRKMRRISSLAEALLVSHEVSVPAS